MDRYDDGSQPRMPDGVIRFPDGRMGALEVIGDHGAGFERQWDALEKQGRHLDSPGLEWTWHVSLDHAVNIKQIRRTLPNFLREIEAQAEGNLHRANFLVRDSEDAERLGVFTAHAYTDGLAGRIRLMSAPFSGFGREADYVVDWIEGVLREQSDVGEKLYAANIGTEGHAFIWVTIGSDVPINSFLDGSMTGLPERSPNLPVGVTHVWVVSGFSSSRSLAWFPDRGWHQLPPLAAD